MKPCVGSLIKDMLELDVSLLVVCMVVQCFLGWFDPISSKVNVISVLSLVRKGRRAPQRIFDIF